MTVESLVVELPSVRTLDNTLRGSPWLRSFWTLLVNEGWSDLDTSILSVIVNASLEGWLEVEVTSEDISLGSAFELTEPKHHLVDILGEGQIGWINELEWGDGLNQDTLWSLGEHLEDVSVLTVLLDTLTVSNVIDESWFTGSLLTLLSLWIVLESLILTFSLLAHLGLLVVDVSLVLAFHVDTLLLLGNPDVLRIWASHLLTLLGLLVPDVVSWALELLASSTALSGHWWARLGLLDAHLLVFDESWWAELSNTLSTWKLSPGVSVLWTVFSDTFVLNFGVSFWALVLLHTVLSVPDQFAVTLVSDTSLRFLNEIVVSWALDSDALVVDVEVILLADNLMAVSSLILLESFWAVLDSASSGSLDELVGFWARNSLANTLLLSEVGWAILFTVITDLGVSSWALLKNTLTVLDFVLLVDAGNSLAFLGGLVEVKSFWARFSDAFLSFNLEVWLAMSLDALTVFEDEWLGARRLNALLSFLVQLVLWWARGQLAFTVLVSSLVLSALSVEAFSLDEVESWWTGFSLTSSDNLLESWLALEVSAFSINEKLAGVANNSVTPVVLLVEVILLWARFSDTFVVFEVEVLWTLVVDTFTVSTWLHVLWTVLDAVFTLLDVVGWALFSLRALSISEVESTWASLQDTLVKLGIEVVELIARSLDTIVRVGHSAESFWAVLQDAFTSLLFESFVTLGEDAFLSSGADLVVLWALLKSEALVSSLFVSLWTSGDSALTVLVDTLSLALNFITSVSSLLESWLTLLSEAVLSDEIEVIWAGLSDTESLGISFEVLSAVLQTDTSSEGVSSWASFSNTASVSQSFTTWASNSDTLSLLILLVMLVASRFDAVTIRVLLGTGWTGLLHASVTVLLPSFWALLEVTNTIFQFVSRLANGLDTLGTFLLGILWTFLKNDTFTILVWLRSISADFSFAVLSLSVLLESWVALSWLTGSSNELVSLITGKSSARSFVFLGSSWTSSSDALLLNEFEVDRTSISDTFTLLQLEVLLTVGVTGFSIKSPSIWAGSSLTGLVFLKFVESWA